VISCGEGSPDCVGEGPMQPAAALGPAHRIDPVAPRPGAPRDGPRGWRRGNPRGNPDLKLAPRCGARARTTGCPCCAPAMANGRCRMHGGRSTGPRTPEGMARMTAAQTTHGRSGAWKRRMGRYVSTVAARGRLFCAAMLLRAHLPAEMAARLAAGPAELQTPDRPCQVPVSRNPDATPCNSLPPADLDPTEADIGRLLTEMVARLAAGPVGVEPPEHPSQAAVSRDPDATPCNSLPPADLDPTESDIGRLLVEMVARLAVGPVDLSPLDRSSEVAVSRNAEAIPCNSLPPIDLDSTEPDTGRLLARPVALPPLDRPSEVVVSKNAEATPCNSLPPMDLASADLGCLLAERAVRLASGPAELQPPKRPSQVAASRNADATPCNSLLPVGSAPMQPVVAVSATGHPDPVKSVPRVDPVARNNGRTAGRGFGRPGGKPRPMSPGREAERLEVLAETADLAPWRQAIAFARAAKRAERAAHAAARTAVRGGRAAAPGERAAARTGRARPAGVETRISGCDPVDQAVGLEPGTGGLRGRAPEPRVDTVGVRAGGADGEAAGAVPAAPSSPVVLRATTPGSSVGGHTPGSGIREHAPGSGVQGHAMVGASRPKPAWLERWVAGAARYEPMHLSAGQESAGEPRAGSIPGAAPRLKCVIRTKGHAPVNTPPILAPAPDLRATLEALFGRPAPPGSHVRLAPHAGLAPVLRDGCERRSLAAPATGSLPGGVCRGAFDLGVFDGGV